jgi:hypothetical protein
VQKLKHSRLLPIIGLLLGMVVWLANNGNPPTGKTAAPFNGNCNECHTGGNFNGNLEVSGFPAVASPNQTYDINIKMTTTVGSPTKAGFQLVVVDANNANCGDLISIAGNGTGTENLQTREYIEHRNGKNFAGGMVSWDFQWKAPANVPGDQVKVYYIVNMCNGNGGTGGDNPIWDNLSFGFSGPPPVTATITNQQNPSCNGGGNGTITVEAAGGNPPYTYLWTGGQTTQTAINLTAGTYTVTVTATTGGSATAVATLTQPSLLNLSTNVVGSVTCVDVATVTASATGGTPGYTFQWSDGQTGEVAIFDQPGAYSVTVSDANGCTRATVANVSGNTTPPTATVAQGGEITCVVTQLLLSGAGSSTGANFTYAWATSNGNIVSGGNTLSPTVNACGTYTLTVTNTTNGCTASASTTVICNNAAPDASAMGGVITCGSPTLILMGNSITPGVTYRWTGPGITAMNQFDQKPEVDQPGEYTLTVTNPANGCTKTVVVVVTWNFAPPTALGSVSGELTCAISSVQLNLTSNAPNPTFSWTGPNGFSSNIANPSVSFSGDYIGTVTNPDNGCQASDTVTVVQNIALPGAMAAALGQLNCVRDTVQLMGNSSAAPNVTYAWTGPGFSSNLQNPVVDTVGAYTLIVTSTVNGCTSSAVANVLENKVSPSDSIVPPGNLNCNNPTIQLNAAPSSQGPNFDYLWTAKEGGHIVSGDTTLTPVVDSTGKYFLTITNTDNGCTSIDSVVVMQSAPVVASISDTTHVGCNGGSNGAATVFGSGGNGVFSYLWNNGDTLATTTGLTAGTYLAMVTDGENCAASVSVTILQPAQLLPNASATGETSSGANDGTATANPSGGTAPYTYLWSNNETTQTIADLTPGIYTVSVTDANGCSALQTLTVNTFGCDLVATSSATNTSCNGSADGLASVSLTGAVNPVSYAWSNGETTQSVNSLAVGIYTVSVVDGEGCSAQLSISISEPPVLAANALAFAETANGANDGSATATPSGGNPNYTYLWSNSETTQTITGLSPGTYTVVVTDDKGCTDEQTVQVSAFNCALSATINAANVRCFGGADGQATVTVNGGALPYTYLWSNGATTQTIVGLMVGTYIVVATDATGCETAQTTTIGQPNLLVANIVSVQNVLCPQDQNGSATIEITGGTPPYSVSWLGGQPNNLGVGNYTVTVTDAANCSNLTSFSITSTDSQAPVITCPATLQICGANFIDYSAAVAQDNCGLAGPPVLISGPVSGSIFLEGTTVIVYQATDASGNSSTCAFNIVVDLVPDILIDEIVNDMGGQGVGSISVTPVGSGGYTYAWNKDGQFFSNNEDLTGLGVGSYTLTITDVNSCTSALSPIVITNTVGTNDPIAQGAVRLWPNPAYATIQLEIIDLDILAAQIVDLRGGLVKTISQTELNSEIEIESLPAGMYCLLFSTSDGRVLSLKFVKS